MRMLDADTRRGRCEVTYQPKTAAEQLALLGQWKAWARNNVSDAVATVLDDLASAKARIAELDAMVRELVEATEAEYHVVAGDQYHMLCPGSAIKVNTTCSWIVMATGERSSHRNKDRVQILNAARAEALALLNKERKDGAK